MGPIERRRDMPRFYRAIDADPGVDRREFVRAAGAGVAVAGVLLLGRPTFGDERPPEVETNIGDFMKVPKTRLSLPGLFPGRVVKVRDPRVLHDEKVDATVAAEMVEKGIRTLTGRSL
jgi:hypothetical protein